MQFSTLLLLTFWVKSWCSLNACFVLLGCYHFPHTTYVCVSVCLFCLLWVFCVVKFIFDWLWIAHMPTKNHGVDINKTNRCFFCLLLLPLACRSFGIFVCALCVLLVNCHCCFLIVHSLAHRFACIKTLNKMVKVLSLLLLFVLFSWQLFRLCFFRPLCALLTQRFKYIHQRNKQEQHLSSAVSIRRALFPFNQHSQQKKTPDSIQNQYAVPSTFSHGMNAVCFCENANCGSFR